MIRSFLSAAMLAALLIVPACAKEEAPAKTEPAVSAPAADTTAKSPAGMWSGDWGPTATHRNQVTLELKRDGDALTGTVNPGPDGVPLKKASYEAGTGMIMMEADAKGHSGEMVHFMINGKIEGNSMMGTWMHGDQKGDFKLTKKP